MTNFHFSARFQQLSAVSIAVVVLLFSVFSGIAGGKGAAQSALIMSNASAIKTGLGYFNGDYGRFPSAIEFAEPNLMRNYFNIFPPQDIVASACSESFDYKRISSSSYQLSFCLPRAAQGFKQGWNTIQE